MPPINPSQAGKGDPFNDNRMMRGRRFSGRTAQRPEMDSRSGATKICSLLETERLGFLGHKPTPRWTRDRHWRLRHTGRRQWLSRCLPRGSRKRCKGRQSARTITVSQLRPMRVVEPKRRRHISSCIDRTLLEDRCGDDGIRATIVPEPDKRFRRRNPPKATGRAPPRRVDLKGPKIACPVTVLDYLTDLTAFDGQDRVEIFGRKLIGVRGRRQTDRRQG